MKQYAKGQRPRSEGQGGKAPEAETLLALKCSTKAANLPVFLYLEAKQNHRYLQSA